MTEKCNFCDNEATHEHIDSEELYCNDCLMQYFWSVRDKEFERLEEK